jgi:hypothetical protein
MIIKQCRDVLALPLFILSTIVSAASPNPLSGARFISNTNRLGDTNASFAIGMTRDAGSSYITTASLNDTVSIVGEVRPEAELIGQKADIFVVERVNGAFTMKRADGTYIPWNGLVADLTPFKQAATLAGTVNVDIFSGMLGVSGDHRVFLGYRPADGILRYTPFPLQLTVSSESPTEQARALFDSTISPDIIQSRCMQCHIPGGAAQAGGAYHIFNLPLAANLESNFRIFQGLVGFRGVDYILTKVTGGYQHGGGVQLTQNMAEYASLRTFISLLAEDLPPPTNPNPPSGSDSDPNYDPYANP